MPKFMLAYHMGNTPPSPETGKADQMRWMQWMKDQGAALIEPQNPLGKSHHVSATGVDSETKGIVGYSVFEGPDLATAIAAAKSCPFLDMGTIEVAEIRQM